MHVEIEPHLRVNRRLGPECDSQYAQQRDRCDGRGKFEPTADRGAPGLTAAIGDKGIIVLAEHEQRLAGHRVFLLGRALDDGQLFRSQERVRPLEPLAPVADDLLDLKQVLALAAAPLGNPHRQRIVRDLVVIADQSQQPSVLQYSQGRAQPLSAAGQTRGDFGGSARLLGPADRDEFIKQPRDPALGDPGPAGFEFGLQGSDLLIEEPGHDIAQLAGVIDLRVGKGNRPAAGRADRTAPQVIEIDLQVGERDTDMLFVELRDDLARGFKPVFQRDPVRGGAAKDHLLDIAVRHRFHAEPLVEQAGHCALERVEHGKVFFAQGDDDPAGNVSAQHRLKRGVELVLLGLGAQHVEFLELVEDQEHRAQVIEVDRAHRLGHRCTRSQRSDRQRVQRRQQRRVQVIAPTDVDRQPVGRAEFGSQPALDQAGLARARCAINQHQPRFAEQPVQRLDLFIAAEKHRAIILRIGIEELERRGSAGRNGPGRSGEGGGHRRATIARYS